MDNFISYLQSLKSFTDIEIESRISIDFDYTEIVSKLCSLQDFIHSQIKDTVLHYNDNKRIIIHNNNKLFQIKNSLHYTKLNLQGYNCKFNISSENNIEPFDDSNPILKRERTRSIFKKEGIPYEFHVTNIIETKNNISSSNTTIEIEYNLTSRFMMTNNITIGFFINPIHTIFNLFYVKSLYPLSLNEITPIFHEFNKLIVSLKYKNPKYIPNRELKLEKYEDKPITLSKNMVPQVVTNNYLVTNKLNGQRYFLFITRGIAYLIYNNGSNISSIKSHVWVFLQVPHIKDDIIIDGEYFNFNYYGFDLLYTTKNNLRYNPFERRLYKLGQVIRDIRHEQIKMKYFKDGTNIHKIISYMENEFKYNWDEYNDGLIFTPKDSKYFDKNSTIYKWKFPHHQSIDVKISFSTIDNNEYCYNILSKNKENILVQFTNFLLKSTVKLNEQIIYEVAFDYKRNNFYVLRTRPDKLEPNFITVANSVLEDILNPIFLSNLIIKNQLVLSSPKDWTIYRKYSNNEKRKLINSSMQHQKESIVLDIGFGKGGDIYKYKEAGVSKIYAVEPDKSNIEEFYNRHKDNLNSLPKVVFINTSGSDPSIKNYINEKIDFICMFYSLTYFFENNHTITDLIHNIASICIKTNSSPTILGTVMDGNQITKLLNNFHFENTGLHLTLNDSKLFIKIDESSTVSGHYEYLVNFYKLLFIFNVYGWELSQINYLSKNIINSTERNQSEQFLINEFSNTNRIFKFTPTGNFGTVVNIQSIMKKYNDELKLEPYSNYFTSCINEIIDKYTIEQIEIYIQHLVKDNNLKDYIIKNRNENIPLTTTMLESFIPLPNKINMYKLVNTNYNSNSTINDYDKTISFIKDSFSPLSTYKCIVISAFSIGQIPLLFSYYFNQVLVLPQFYHQEKTIIHNTDLYSKNNIKLIDDKDDSIENCLLYIEIDGFTKDRVEYFLNKYNFTTKQILKSANFNTLNNFTTSPIYINRNNYYSIISK